MLARGAEIASSMADCTVARQRAQCWQEEHQKAEEQFSSIDKQKKAVEQQLAECQRSFAERTSELHSELHENVANADVAQKELQWKLEDRAASAEAGYNQLQQALKDWHSSPNTRDKRLEQQTWTGVHAQQSSREAGHAEDLRADLQQAPGELGMSSTHMSVNGSDCNGWEHAEVQRFVEEMRWQQKQSKEENNELENASRQLRVEKERAREAKAVERQLREALRSREDEIDALEGALEKLQHRYERKLAKSHRQLAERESYEQKLKSLLEKEVDVLHRYNSDLPDFPRPPPLNLAAQAWSSSRYQDSGYAASRADPVNDRRVEW